MSTAGQEVLGVRGDRDHPISRGYTCPKGRALGRIHQHPQRLDHPQLRRDGVLSQASWEELFDDLGGRLREMVAGDPDSVAIYRGTASFFDAAGMGLEMLLKGALGTRSHFTSLTVDGVGAFFVNELVSGNPALLPMPDVDAEMTILMGTNPMISHGHTYGMSRPKEQLRAWANQGELWVVDPRRTESAAVATRHLAPRAGTDYILLAHLVRELLRDGADREFLAQHTSGVAELAAAVAPFDLDQVVAQTGLDPLEVQDLLAAIRRAGRIACVNGTGLTFSRHANVTVWLVWALNAITGSLDKHRGIWFNPGYLAAREQHPWEPTDGVPQQGPRSRPELPSRFGEMPCAALVDEIESGHVRALIVLGGNPLTAFPGPARLKRALQSLEVLVVGDILDGELTRLATHVLPLAGPLERDDVTVIETTSIRSSGQYTSAVVEPAAERRSQWRVLAELSRRVDGAMPLGLDPEGTPDRAALEALYGTNASRWASIVAAETAVPAPHRPYGWVGENLPEGGWRLAPAELVDQLAQRGVGTDHDPSLTLTSMRQRRKINSLLADGHGIAQPDEAHVFLNPADAGALGLVHGEDVVVSSAHGELTLPLRVDEAIVARGTAAIPHGFVEANVEHLCSPDDVDPLTGMPTFTALSVSVRRASPRGASHDGGAALAS